jgi:hypothetical protein
MNITLEDTDTPEDIGRKLAARFMWSDTAIMECMLEALTDSNFHSMRAKIEDLYNKEALK